MIAVVVLIVVKLVYNFFILFLCNLLCICDLIEGYLVFFVVSFYYLYCVVSKSFV